MSCSFIVPVKRIDLLILGLAQLARDRRDVTFDWAHFGDGPREQLLRLAETRLPPNVTWRFMDFPGRKRLYEYYCTEPIDVFVNTSASEGTPVSVMEAISAGIPVVGTDVGGNPEIITPENGVLLSADFDAVEFSRVFSSLIGDPAALRRLRMGSAAKWAREYNAAANYMEFADEMTRVLGAGVP